MFLGAGVTNFWHGGGLYSHYTLAWHFPERDVALYAVANGYSGDSKPFAVVESLAYYSADLLLGYQPWLDQSSVCTYPKPWASGGGGSPPNRTEEGKDGGGDLNGDSEEGKRGEETVKFGREGKGGGLKSGLLGFAGQGEKFAAASSLKFAPGVEESEGEEDRLSASSRLNRRTEENTAAEDRDQSRGAVETADLSRVGKKGAETLAPTFPVKSYRGLYRLPLFGNFSVFLKPESEQLECGMNILTGILHPLEGARHTFGVELTQSLRFLSKPSGKSPARNAFKVAFVESDSGEITAVDVYSHWAIEVPLRFHKMR